MRVVVVIGDIVASRSIKDRKSLQAKLEACVDAANHERVRDLLSPYTITLGDEVQSVYSRPKTAVLDVLAFKARFKALEPELAREMRFCIGIGEITTRLNKRAAIGMDGPAFYCAREGIDALKKDAKSTLAVQGEQGIDVTLEDSALKLIDFEMSAWRTTRFQVFLALLSGTPVKSISKQLGLSQVAVYKNISEGRLHLIANTATTLGNSLQQKLGVAKVKPRPDR